MIINELVCKPDGTQELVQKEVPDDYFNVPAPEPTTSRAEALAEIQKATTIAGLKAAMLNYIEVSGVE